MSDIDVLPSKSVYNLGLYSVYFFEVLHTPGRVDQQLSLSKCNPLDADYLYFILHPWERYEVRDNIKLQEVKGGKMLEENHIRDACWFSSDWLGKQETVVL